MRKAYILAFQRATNYGAVLQIFALKTVLESMGLEVVVIDYVPDWMRATVKNQPTILSYVKRKVMNFTFLPIFRMLGLSSKTKLTREGIKRIIDGDYYFVGSDQVWNPRIMKEDLSYFLDFVPSDALRIGYAVSMGGVALSKEFCAKAILEIEKFKYLSGREAFVCDFVKKNFPEMKVPKVLDPTLLLDFEDYSIVKAKRQFTYEYILVYTAMHDSHFVKLAFHLREITGLKIVNVGHYFSGADIQESFKGPENWLNRIEQASFFITNSFHGTVFSILSRGNFMVVPSQTNLHLNARFEELLESLDLSQRLVYNKHDVDRVLLLDVDYDVVNEKLARFRESSKQFIRNAVS